MGMAGPGSDSNRALPVAVTAGGGPVPSAAPRASSPSAAGLGHGRRVQPHIVIDDLRVAVIVGRARFRIPEPDVQAMPDGRVACGDRKTQRPVDDGTARDGRIAFDRAGRCQDLQLGGVVQIKEIQAVPQ